MTETILKLEKEIKRLKREICCLTSSLEADRVGGQSPFTADGVTTIFDIVHNAGFEPSFFTITSSVPVAVNHLSRTITFPDENTMRLTFGIPPAPGEDANYVWIVYK